MSYFHIYLFNQALLSLALIFMQPRKNVAGTKHVLRCSYGDDGVKGSYGEDVRAGDRLLAYTLQLGLDAVDDAEVPQRPHVRSCVLFHARHQNRCIIDSRKEFSHKLIKHAYFMPNFTTGVHILIPCTSVNMIDIVIPFLFFLRMILDFAFYVLHFSPSIGEKSR